MATDLKGYNTQPKIPPSMQIDGIEAEVHGGRIEQELAGIFYSDIDSLRTGARLLPFHACLIIPLAPVVTFRA